MSAKCEGLNYALRLHEGAIEMRSRRLRGQSATVEMSKVKSIELLRKSVMPPAAIGATGLLLHLILTLTDGWLDAVFPEALRTFSALAALAVAAICLAVLIVRWFFSELIVKPCSMRPVKVRMVPTGSARRFVMLAQTQALTSQET